jgi:uncharacterized protein involved in high-affinity Fe2+ transport
MEQKIGAIIAVGVLVVAGGLLLINLRIGTRRPVAPGSAAPIGTQGVSDAALAADFREYPIGDTERNQMKIAAVWLPPVQMEGLELPQDDGVIHLEADIHALAGNRNGFGLGAWIPYLSIHYRIAPEAAEAEAIEGSLLPMVAKDGPHYGATLHMPGPGKYRLTYAIEPPSKNGFGRHSDPITGVDPWWDPFTVEFPFEYAPPTRDALPNP